MKLRASIIFLILLLCSGAALACPDIDGVLDRNCDGVLSITGFGDSITYGRGDSKGIGYPGRLKKYLPSVKVRNLGSPGESSFGGKRRARTLFRRRTSADFVIVLEGVNDYWDPEHDVDETKDNLLDICDYASRAGAATMLAKLTAVRRRFQKGWVMSVNRAISQYTEIDLYALGEKIIGRDQLHPSSAGYETITRAVVRALIKETPNHRPPDLDRDHIYDFAEQKYGTLPGNPDSDNDGLLDGDELFVYRTGALRPDTDGDTFSDGDEVERFLSSPLDPQCAAPVLLSIVPAA